MSAVTQDQAPNSPLLQVAGLDILYQGKHHSSVAARDVSFNVGRGEIFGLVGETGSGKSTILRSIIGLLHRNARVQRGSIRLAGQEVTGLNEAALANLRRKHVAMIFQDPLRALNPVMPVGKQLEEVLAVSGKRDSAEVRRMIVEMLGRVGIADPEVRMRAYPHELSGGLRQRVAIAAAMIRSPDLILADEPTTALDVTIQDQILTLLYDLCRQTGMSVLLVTHDLGIVAGTCDKVGVLYAGRLVETGDVATVLTKPSHPYTAALLSSIPRIGQHQSRLPVIPGRASEFPLQGCPFAPRCAHAVAQCETVTPVLEQHSATQASACWRHADLRDQLARQVRRG